MESKPRIFISYARSDGEEFALGLRTKLVAEFGREGIWRDRDKMEGGVAWWQQITDALDAVEYMVLIASPNAIQSSVVRKEWRYARQQGVCVYPVLIPTLPIDFASLPRWMRDSHFYHLDKEWENFLEHLKNTCETIRVPFFGVPDLPSHFVERPTEFSALLDQMLDEKRDNPVAITTSIVGAGGFGKTTLAAALCHDENVQRAFDDGILWITLGEEPRVVDELSKLYRALTGEILHFVDSQEGASMLAEKLADRDILIVIDDVWDSNHLKPFLQGGARCARLITTRFVPIAVEAQALQNTVDEMSNHQAVQLLLAGIDQPIDLRSFEQLSVRLGEWPLMLEIANGMLRSRIALGNSLAKAVEWLLLLLEKRKVRGIQRENEEDRKRSALGVLGASFEQLSELEQLYLFQLAIFKDDSAIPLSSIGCLWGLDEFDSDEHLSKFAFACLLKYDPEQALVRLHDVVREVLAMQLIECGQPLAYFHAKLVKAYGDLTDLPDNYAWEQIAYHLHCAEMDEMLSKLLLDIHFLQAKLKIMNANALIDDCNYVLNERSIALLQSTLNMSQHILSQDPAQLLIQLYGRLLGHKESQNRIAIFLEHISDYVENMPEVGILPLHPTMQQAGGAIIRQLVGHEAEVNTVAIQGDIAISASSDTSLIVWNWQTGELIRRLLGHTKAVNAVIIQGEFVISASRDKSLIVWNWQTGTLVRRLEGHSGSVEAIVIQNDFAISASRDKSLIVWNWQTGTLVRRLEGHSGSVYTVAIQGECIISASEDKSLIVWNWQTSTLVRRLEGHSGTVYAVAIQGDIAISASSDTSLIVWNWQTGELIRRLLGHSKTVNAVATQGEFGISASYDESLIVWNWQTGALIRRLEGHSGSIYAVATQGEFAVSASSDTSLIVWNWRNSVLVQRLEGHSGWVNSIVMQGEFIVSTSSDTSLIVWNWQTGALIRRLEGHSGSIYAVAIQGDIAISASSDESLIVWNWQTGTLVRRLEGHSDYVYAVAIQGDIAISASSDESLIVWNWQTGTLVRRLTGHHSWVTSVVMRGDIAISASSDESLIVWNWQTGTLIHQLEGHSGSIYAVAIQGEHVVAASSDTSLIVWNWQTGALIRRLKVHISGVKSVALHNTIAISVSDDKSFVVWDWQNGDCLLRTPMDASQNACGISEGVIATGDDGGNLHLFWANAALRKLLGWER
jgi:WD40 repeat protein